MRPEPDHSTIIKHWSDSMQRMQANTAVSCPLGRQPCRDCCLHVLGDDLGMLVDPGGLEISARY